MGASGGEDEAGCISSESCAIVNSGHPPLRPTSQSTLGHTGYGDIAGPSSRSDPETSGSDTEHLASGSASDIESDLGNESGVVDTDIELESIAPDDASQHTFGPVRHTLFDFVAKVLTVTLGMQQSAGWYFTDPNERRQEAGSPATFVTNEDYDSDMSESGSRALAAIRRTTNVVRMASTREHSSHATNSDIVPSQSNSHQREDNTTTIRRSSYNDSERDAFVTLTSSNGDQQSPLPHANRTMLAKKNAGISSTDNSGKRVNQGINLMNAGDLEGWDTRRSSFSFMAPRSLPLPPSKDKRKSKDREKRKKDKERGKNEGFDITAMRGLIRSSSDSSAWAEAGDATGPRRPSNVTLDDSFASGLRRDDPDYASRRKEWSFIHERSRVSFPPREPNGNPRRWDVWRCSQIGRIRIERATLMPCPYISVPFS